MPRPEALEGYLELRGHVWRVQKMTHNGGPVGVFEEACTCRDDDPELKRTDTNNPTRFPGLFVLPWEQAAILINSTGGLYDNIQDTKDTGN